MYRCPLCRNTLVLLTDNKHHCPLDHVAYTTEEAALAQQHMDNIDGYWAGFMMDKTRRIEILSDIYARINESIRVGANNWRKTDDGLHIRPDLRKR